jgi:hypothetical protein
MPDHKLNVLVLETERGEADVARHELAAAGHNIVRCHEPGSSAFPCNALATGHTCPLETDVVDVALDVRRRPRSQPAPLEDGVRCALQHHIPLVVAGSPVLNPYSDYAAEIIDREADVVDACERVATAPLAEHTALATRTLATVLERRSDTRPAPRVTVRRRRGALLVEVADADQLDDATKAMAAVRVSGALRALDRHARAIDVIFSR